MRFHFKRILVLLFVATAILMSGCAPDAVDSDGKPINISDFRGKWVLINYWATWCQPCMSEIPALNNLREYYKDKVVVLGVNYDRLNRRILQELKKSYGIRYHLLSYFPIEKWGVKEISGIPVTFLINPKGKLTQTLQGPQTFQGLQNIMQLPPITYR